MLMTALKAQAVSLRLATALRPNGARIDVRRLASRIAADRAAMLGPSANTAKRLLAAHLRSARPWREAAAHHAAVANAMRSNGATS